MRFNRGRRYTYYSSYSNSRRPRIRWDRIAIIGGVTFLVIGALVWFNLSRLKLMFKGYSFSQQNDVLSLTSEEINEILAFDKMEHIQDWIAESENVKYYDEYEQYKIIHKDIKVNTVVETIDDIFTNYTPRLEALSYTNEQIWDILKTASIDDLKYLIDHGYTYDQIQAYMKVKGFVFSDMEKYMKVYAEKNNYNYAVLSTTYPFIISTNKVTQTYTIQDPTNILNLVKKGFQLPSSYEPEDLIQPLDISISPDIDTKNSNSAKLRKEAADALTQMYHDAKKLGYNLVLNSAYRSYSEQKAIYDEYFAKYDEVTAASLVAMPGASEHQTGLGVDLTSQSVISGERLVFGDTVEYKWCVENSYKYGFILRFEENKANITGIGKEPWHFRYVGKDAAKKIYENKWTLEEYCLYEGVIPNIKES